MHAAAANAEDATPEDLRFPPHFVPAPLDEQIRWVRHELNRFITAHKEATDLQRGHGALAQSVYTREYHRRRSALHSLVMLKAQLENHSHE